MLRLFSMAVFAATLGACASTPMTAIKSDDPAMRALLTNPRGDAELAGQAFDMVELLQARIGFELAVADATEITFATNQALAAVTPGAEFLWASPDSTHGGDIRLWRMDAMGDGRICAILQHEHVFGESTVRGNVTTCRREGVDWWLDDWEWVITGADFGGL